MSTRPLNIHTSSSKGAVCLNIFYVLSNGNQITQTVWLKPDQVREMIKDLQVEAFKADQFLAGKTTEEAA